LHGNLRPLPRVRAGMSHATSGGIAVITGASSGIGRATALLFAGQGWPLGLIGRTDACAGFLLGFAAGKRLTRSR
jgi:NAD(P)-dependent dehydrogenase (short-subunit alcohol dehydrogenase family)